LLQCLGFRALLLLCAYHRHLTTRAGLSFSVLAISVSWHITCVCSRASEVALIRIASEVALIRIASEVALIRIASEVALMRLFES